MRYVVVNADDFGFTRDVNDGIVEAHLRGILTATTLMANGMQFEHAVELAKQHPTLDIGVHLVLCGGQALTTGRPLPATVSELIAAIVRGQLDYAAEIEAQVRRVLDAGLQPTHLDTHKHTHLLPPVLDAVARLSERHGIRWVRRPFDLPLKQGRVPWSRRVVSRSLQFVRRRFHHVLAKHNCLTTDYFAGFQMTGYLQTPDLIQTLRQLPPGSTEFMTHPAFCTGELRAARTRLKESRQRELEALTAPETLRAVKETGIRVMGYRQLESLAGQNSSAGV
ncbi:MAG: ChbG/HpnK family deacetylase [Bryobacterales bacterium]|nr:ChbG/HpnK family deacetylase [Bryobacterales bacterium]